MRSGSMAGLAAPGAVSPVDMKVPPDRYGGHGVQRLRAVNRTGGRARGRPPPVLSRRSRGVWQRQELVVGLAVMLVRAPGRALLGGVGRGEALPADHRTGVGK